MAQRRVKYSEAVGLICSQCQIGRGEADALFWRAVLSRENGPAWTEAAIINRERLALRGARASFDVRRMLDWQAAHQRAKARLRLLVEPESAAFKDAVIAGEIVFSEAALLSWLSRNRPPLAPTEEPAPAGGRKLLMAVDAIKDLHPNGPLPSDKVLHGQVCDRLGLSEQGLSLDTIRRARRKISNA